MRDGQADEMLQAQRARSGKSKGKIYGEIVWNAFLRAFRHDRFDHSDSAVFDAGCGNALLSHAETVSRKASESFRIEFFRNFTFTPNNFSFYPTPRV